jgi:carbon storage regulator
MLPSARDVLYPRRRQPAPLKEEADMLVLTRKPAQSILIAGCVKVTVVAVEGGRVRLGFEAPPEVAIDREEVHQRIREFAVDSPLVVEAAYTRYAEGR